MRTWLWLACAARSALAAQTISDTGVPGAGHGALTLGTQLITISERTRPAAFGGGIEEFGEITLRSAWLGFDYGIGERFALTGSIPYKSNRYRGDFPHDPGLLDDPHGEEFLDDGRYHSNWGDFGIGVVLSEHYTLSADYGRTVAIDFGHKYRRALTLGLARRF